MLKAPLRVAAFSTTDNFGGAARAALRIHQAVSAAGAESTLHVSRRGLAEPSVVGPRGPVGKAAALVRPRLGGLPLRLSSANESKRSLALLPSSRVRRLNRSDAHLCHLHWVADEMLSIEDIGRIAKPVVWTLHDMWAFCGAEHYAYCDRYCNAYNPGSRPVEESGIDLNRWTWKRKRRSWRHPMHIVAPSRWMAECVRSSALMKGWPVEVIPYPIDLGTWRPMDKEAARSLLGIRAKARLVAFGSMGENRGFRKGGDLLFAALRRLAGVMPDLELLVFGEHRSDGGEDLGIPAHHVGILHDDLSLRIVYSAAEALVVPSRMDNLPGTAIEALACGTPVVAFDTCGLPDVVVHEETGYLARPFEPDDLARGILWTVGDPERSSRLARSARAFAEEQFAPARVAARYLALYEAVALASLRDGDT